MKKSSSDSDDDDAGDSDDDSSIADPPSTGSFDSDVSSETSKEKVDSAYK
jgi:hypothetical protein